MGLLRLFFKKNPTELSAIDKRLTQSGNVFMMLFGAVGMVGVIGASTMTVMKGPVKTMSEVTKRTVAENNMIASGKLALIASASQANSDCDGDLTLEPIEPGASMSGFTGGGLLPSVIGTSKTDPWGTDYVYCAWNHGTSLSGNGCGSGLLNGSSAADDYVLAIVSAGPDRMFDTTCNAYVDSTTDLVIKQSGADDLILGYTYAEASAASGGLWNLSDPNTASIQKDLIVQDSGGVDTFALNSATGDLTLGSGATGSFPNVNVDVITSYSGTNIEFSNPITGSLGTLSIVGPINADSDFTTAGDLIGVNVTASGTVQGDALQSTGSLDVVGMSTLADTTITSLSALDGTLELTSNLDTNGISATTLTTSGNVVLGSNVTNTVNIAGSTSIGDDLNISGSVNVGTNLDVTGTSNLSSLDVSGQTNLVGLAVTNTIDAVSGVKLGTGVICDASNEGTISYNDTDKKLYICDGINWTGVGTEFDWVPSSWSACSNTCGSGVQNRTVVCRNTGGLTVADSFCSNAKPPLSQSCYATSGCTTDWQYGTWGGCSATPNWSSYGSFGSCSNSCGSGTQTRYRTCQNTTGIRTRTATCLRSDGVFVDNSQCTTTPNTTMSCTENCSGSNSDSQSCYGTSGCSYNWQYGSWSSCSASPTWGSWSSYSSCSASCGTGTRCRSRTCFNTSGVRTRSATCRRSDGAAVSSTFCSGSPYVSQSCSVSCSGSSSDCTSCSNGPCMGTTGGGSCTQSCDTGLADPEWANCGSPSSGCYTWSHWGTGSFGPACGSGSSVTNRTYSSLNGQVIGFQCYGPL